MRCPGEGREGGQVCQFFSNSVQTITKMTCYNYIDISRQALLINFQQKLGKPKGFEPISLWVS